MKKDLGCGPDTIIVVRKTDIDSVTGTAVVCTSAAAAASAGAEAAAALAAAVARQHIARCDVTLFLLRQAKHAIYCTTVCAYLPPLGLTLQGHSSGAAAAMRFAEADKVAGTA
jgi:hypothetical protein